LNGQPAIRYGRFELVDIRPTRVRRLVYGLQDRSGGTHATLRADFHERAQTLNGELLNALVLRRRDPRSTG
jgi:hypothetical protein